MGAHGGMVTYVRTTTPGATFRLTFPDTDAEAAPVAESQTAGDQAKPAAKRAAA
jgi:hypothetical protein